ncbi:MAG: histidine phosphatase family protein [Devosiaceae bacterium]|nr:histidine phosphatase family protein [Devosiaceae bacterium]
MTDWPQLFFARHGETSWNLERRYQGSKDIPLNETGRAQANSIGPLLVDMLAAADIDPKELDWFASPLSRASETMTRMRQAFEVELPEVQFDDRLREISFGIMEGKLHSELEINSPVPVGERAANYWNYCPPEGESYNDVVRRLQDFASNLTKTTVIVAHGGILRAVRHMISNMPQKDALNWRVPQGAIAHFVDGNMNMHFAPDQQDKT